MTNSNLASELNPNNSTIKTVTVAYGDGIGPEIMESTLRILHAAKARLKINVIEVGKKIYEKGFGSGLMPSAWESLNESRVLLKAPITTPQGGGYKSLNVTLRKKLALYANVRPVVSFHPFVATNFPKMDVAIIRENEEDLYAGIEYRLTEQNFECLKLVSKAGCERIIRYAFEYAVINGRKKISCFSKDNIMKMTDGLFHQTFDQIAKEYPQIATDHHIIDIACAKLAARPEIFDVIVTMNLYGDIISDIAAEISGSVGLAGSANIGADYAMFEAIHGSAPDIAGQNIANPTGLINAAVMMLAHLGQNDIANNIRNALYRTIEEGIHTADIYRNPADFDINFSRQTIGGPTVVGSPGIPKQDFIQDSRSFGNPKISRQKASTSEFADAVISNLGLLPNQLAAANFKNLEQKISSKSFSSNSLEEKKSAEKSLIGFDLFIDWKQDFQSLMQKLKAMESSVFELKMVSAKGLLLFPLIDSHMMPNYDGGLTVLRFIGKGITGKNSSDIIDAKASIAQSEIIEMFSYCLSCGLDFVKFEGLYLFEGKPGFSSGQGE